jgi:hypothetical protein
VNPPKEKVSVGRGEVVIAKVVEERQPMGKSQDSEMMIRKTWSSIRCGVSGRAAAFPLSRPGLWRWGALVEVAVLIGFPLITTLR